MSRYSRYEGLLSEDQLRSQNALIIGVGSIGRQVAITLATIGFGRIILVDPDTVEDVNLGTQGYCPRDIDMEKVHATADIIEEINPDMTCHCIPKRMTQRIIERLTERDIIPTCVFMCIDTLRDRLFLWKRIFKEYHVPYIDGRMAVENLRILSILNADQETYDHYEETLTDADEQFEGRCTEKSTYYCANIAAGIMIAQYLKYLRSLLVPRDIMFDIRTDILSIIKD